MIQRLHWLAGVLGLAVALLFMLAVYATLRSALTQHTSAARLASGLVEDTVTRTLESAETTLLAVASATRQAAGPPDREPSNTLPIVVDQTLRFTPYMRQLVVVDAEGRVIVDSTGPPSDRHIDLDRLGLGLGTGWSQPGADGTISPDGATLHRGLLLGTEIPGRYLPTRDGPDDLSPRTTLPVAVNAGPNRWVIGALNPANLRLMLDHGRLGPAGAVWLTRLDGAPILKMEDPATSVLRDRALALLPLVDAGVESGVLPLPGQDGTGPHGTAAFRLSARYPLAVVVAVSRRDGIAAWLRDDSTMLFWGAVSLLGLLGGGALLLRETIRRGRLENRLRLVGLTQAVFAHSSEAMLITDPDTRIIAANPAFLEVTGHTMAAVVGRPASDFLSPDAAPDPAAEEIETDGRAHDLGRDVWRLACQSGEARSVVYREAPLCHGATILTLNDITDRIAAERALSDALQRAELANRAKTEFLASMSHELRTPLNAILGFSEILRDQVFGPVGSPQYRDYATDIHSSGTHLRDIINDLLDLAKIDAGQFELDPAPLDINEEIGACCRLVSERLNNHGLTLILDRPIAHPMVLVDARVFRQMLFNLLSNAIKFTPTGGTITVFCRRDDRGGMSVAVRDTGIGIPPNAQRRIFEAYKRAINTETRHIEGSGLGLALVKSMMDLHGGTVTVDSVPERGSTFTLVFPADRCLPRLETG
ncbi:sensor histidine kinase [Roseospira visakhapatnamensis]|uniref:histidine kinase n=1 Tax=Roseospira visakhapatnamensis TaxID=390880 RepID=A0A7W6WA99_9PROT|nr:ATP-binding protein [Roseospira visakhapatnamensis]MBB4266256.1 PAS domain S-box-containing protein [Roseospira visakhapatnamensis]